MSRGRGTREATAARFAERAAAARRQRLRQWLAGVGVVALALAMGWVLMFSAVFDTRAVEVTGADPADTRAVERTASREVGTPLARVDGGALAQDITEAVPGAAHVAVDRDWPHTLKVKVTSRVPALAVRTERGDFRLLDLDGTAIRTVASAPKGVPTVRAERGSTVSGHGVRAAQGMLTALPAALRPRVSKVTVDSADQISMSLDGTTVIWGDAGSPDVKVKVIQILLEKRPKVIDVSAPDTPVTKG